jgi:hypothetical protein
VRARLLQRFDRAGAFVLRARWTGFVGVPDPTITGASVSLASDGGAETTSALPGEQWRKRRGFRFVWHDPAGGFTMARLRLTRRGGKFTLEDTTGRVRVEPGTQALSMQIRMGDLRWCAEIASGGLRESQRRLRARMRDAPAVCPCPPLPESTLEAIRVRVFNRHTCSVLGCHGGPSGGGGLVLGDGDLHARLVSVPSFADPTTPRVTPGEPARSMLWLKLAARTLGTPGAPGNSMPIGEPAVDGNELQAIAEWILAGAPATGKVSRAHELLDCR